MASNNVVEDVLHRLHSTEKEVGRLASSIGEIEKKIDRKNKDPIQLEKLKYRLQILQKEIESEKNVKCGHMKNVLKMLTSYFQLTIHQIFPQIQTIPVVQPSAKKFGEYQCNAALGIASKLKKNGRIVAEEIVSNFPKNTLVVKKLEVAGAGFINIELCPQFLSEEVRNVCLNGVQFPPLLVKQKVLVDFSSPNVAKEMHVGHLRSTIIGDSICRLLEELGHEVLRINHVGDWGTQFGMLIAHLQQTFPDYLKEGFEIPISDLQEFYKESKGRFDTDEEFKKLAYACVVKLQAKEDDYIRAWNLICDISRHEFSKIYKRLDVNIVERGESFYQDQMKSLVEKLKSQDLLEEDEGRWIMWTKNPIMDKNPPLTMIKSDGGFTYDTSDFAAVKYRLEEDKATWIIYVTDSGQATHFYTIWECTQRAGILDRSKIRIDHAGFGVVLGDDKKKFKTRSGDTVKLADLLDEGLKRAGDKLRERGRDKELSPDEFEIAQRAVAYGCIKYADLAHSRNGEYVFSFDRMLDDKGNTAVYLLYAYARIKSIARKAGVTESDILLFVQQNPLQLEHEKEIRLALQILRFPEVIDRVVEDLYLHGICEALYDTAAAFAEFYDVCYCIETDWTTNEKKVNMSRLALCEATASILKKGFDILGITSVDRM